MLSELAIRDILLIEELRLAFQPGLNVLTGETGAGKSILLDSLGFALGWRGRGDMVRSGAREGEVTAVFELAPDHPAQRVLEEAGLPRDDALILRRVATADGRKRAFVNDRRASGEVMRALSETLVELHGQQDDKGLLDPSQHRALLDAYGGAPVADALAAVSEAWTTRQAAERALETARLRLATVAEDREYLTHAVAELTRFAPEPGEDAALDTQRRQMQLAEKLREELERARHALLGADGAEGRLADTLRWVEGAAAQAEGALDGAVEAISRALTEVGEAERGLVAFLDGVGGDAATLESVEERLFALRALARKHGVPPDALPELADRLAGDLAAIAEGDAGLAALTAEAEAAGQAYGAAADRLSAARQKAAARLDGAMSAELAPLKLDRARFVTSLTQSGEHANRLGQDVVTFRVATAPGAAPGPINRIASGGELSRFLLALKVCLAGRTPGLTMIFDEIDRGVGGATADAVGRRLAALAAEGQVLVVTHSPQVAALGAHHWQVAKRVADDGAATDVRPLSPEERRDEIARMLAGDVVTDAARAAAEALLAG